MLNPPPVWSSKQVWQRLVSRFKLTSSPSGTDLATLLLFRQNIQPVTDFDEALITPKVGYSGAKDLSGAGWVTLFTVPTGKRWRLLLVWLSGLSAATAVRLYDGTETVPLWGGSVNEQVWTGSRNHILTEAWQIGAYGTSNAGDNARTCRILYLEEDLQT